MKIVATIQWTLLLAALIVAFGFGDHEAAIALCATSALIYLAATKCLGVAKPRP